MELHKTGNRIRVPAIIVASVAILLIFLAPPISNAQSHVPPRQTKAVLDSNIIGQEFVFRGTRNDVKHSGLDFYISGKREDTTYLKYLGMLHTRKGKVYKIVNSIWIWPVAESYRGTTRLLVFDSTNRYVGVYDFSITADAPDTIIHNRLVFRNTANKWRDGTDCDSTVTTWLSFEGGIPKSFFRKCRKDSKGEFSGDIYEFSGEHW